MSVPALPEPAGLDFTLRQYQGTADLAEIGRVRAAIRVVEPHAWLPGPDVGDEATFDRYTLIGSLGGRTVAYTWMTRWAEADGTVLWLLLGWVDPAARGLGIGRALLAWQERAAIAHAVAEYGAVPKHAVFGGNADDDQPSARDLLLAAGYRIAFTTVSLVCDATGRTPSPLPCGLVEQPVTPERHPRIHAAIEECFAHSRHGHVPRGFEGYLHDVESRHQDPDLWCVAWDCDEVAGVVIVERQRAGEVELPWVAVRERWRRRGLATAMLDTVIARCADAGIRTINIRTVQENENRTVGLYEQVGFRVVQRCPRYRKPMPGSGTAV